MKSGASCVGDPISQEVSLPFLDYDPKMANDVAKNIPYFEQVASESKYRSGCGEFNHLGKTTSSFPFLGSDGPFAAVGGFM
jgi:shikimate kinase